MVFQVLAELNRVLKTDTGLELNVSKTSIFPKGTTQQDVFDVTHNIMTSSLALTQFRVDVSLDSFCLDGFVGIGVPIGSDAFVQNFVANTELCS